MEKNNEDVKANYQSCYHAIRNKRHSVLREIVAVSPRRNGRQSERHSRRRYSYLDHYYDWEGK